MSYISDENGYESGGRRITSLLFILLILAIIILVRLFQKSVLENESYLAQAQSQHRIIEEVPAHRGEILAGSYGSDELYVLSTNLSMYAVSVVPKHIQDTDDVANKLSLKLGIDRNELFEKIKGDEAYLPPIAHKVSMEKANEIAGLDLDGVYILPEEWRYYPEGNLASHIIGYVDSEGKGNYGIEGYYDEELRGDSGAFFAEKDVKGRYIQVSGKSEPHNGKSLVLTIDRSIQNYIEKLIRESVKKYGAQRGEIIIMDPENGGIIAMAASEDFDPNNYSKEAEAKSVNIFTNPCIAEAYEPGSVLKVVTMAAGIDSGSVTPLTEENFPAYVEVQGYKIYTWNKKSHGRQNMTQVLETSNNVGLVFVQQRMGKETFYNYLKDKFGYGSKMGIDLDTESGGSMESRQTFRDINAANVSFGQGIALTSLQLVTSFSAIANQGKLMQPQVVKEIIETNEYEDKVNKVEPKFVRNVISKESAFIITSMLVSVVENGYDQSVKIPGYKIAGKTGTAQIPGPGGYLQDTSIHTFAGFAPADDPKFVAVIKLDRPSSSPWSSDTTTYVFKELASYLFKHYQIKPS